MISVSSRNRFFHSKPPLPLVLAVVANLILILVIEVLAFYPLPEELTPQVLGQWDPQYKNCQFLGDYSDRYYLVQTQSGQAQLLALQSHRMLPFRCRIPKRSITPVEDPQQGGTYKVKNGLLTDTVTVSEGRITQVWGHGGGTTRQGALAVYFLLAGTLAFGEGFLIGKLKGEL